MWQMSLHAYEVIRQLNCTMNIQLMGTIWVVYTVLTLNSNFSIQSLRVTFFVINRSENFAWSLYKQYFTRWFVKDSLRAPSREWVPDSLQSWGREHPTSVTPLQVQIDSPRWPTAQGEQLGYQGITTSRQQNAKTANDYMNKPSWSGKK